MYSCSALPCSVPNTSDIQALYKFSHVNCVFNSLCLGRAKNDYMFCWAPCREQTVNIQLMDWKLYVHFQVAEKEWTDVPCLWCLTLNNSSICPTLVLLTGEKRGDSLWMKSRWKLIAFLVGSGGAYGSTSQADSTCKLTTVHGSTNNS